MKQIYQLEYSIYTTYNFQSIPYFSKLFSQFHFSPTLFSEVVTGEFWVTHSHWTQDEFRVGRLTDFWLELHVWVHPVAFFCLCSNRVVSVCSTQRWWVVTGVLYVFPSMDTQDGHSNPFKHSTSSHVVFRGGHVYLFQVLWRQLLCNATRPFHLTSSLVSVNLVMSCSPGLVLHPAKYPLQKWNHFPFFTTEPSPIVPVGGCVSKPKHS